MKKQLFSLLLIFIMLASIFSFATVVAEEDTTQVRCVEKEGKCCLGEICSETQVLCIEGSFPKFERCSDDCISIVKCEEFEDDSKEDDDSQERLEANKGPSDKSRSETRERKILRNGEEFTITQTREFTRERNEDGSITEVKVRITEITNAEGEIIKRIGVEKTRERTFGEDGENEVETKLKVEETNENNETKIRLRLSNNETKELRVLPDRASEIAKERLKVRNLTRLELKEKIHNNIPAVVYNIEANKNGKFLGIFKFAMKVSTEVDPETGEVITTSKPWWAFLVSEPEETPEENNENVSETDERTCTEILTEAECSLRSDCKDVFDDNQLWSRCEVA